MTTYSNHEQRQLDSSTIHRLATWRDSAFLGVWSVYVDGEQTEMQFEVVEVDGLFYWAFLHMVSTYGPHKTAEAAYNEGCGRRP